MRKFSWFGLVVVILGLYWLLGALGINFRLGHILWPLVIFCLGLVSAVSGRRLTFWNLAMMFGGVYWALSNLRVVVGFDFTVIGPVLIILLGISILLPTARMGRRSEAGDTFSSVSIFSGDKRALVGKTFTSANIVCIFGGCELDMTGYESFAPRSYANCTMIFGGGELVIPAHVRVERRGDVSIFGGVSIKGAPAPDASCVLELSGLILFGGATLKYASYLPPA